MDSNQAVSGMSISSSIAHRAADFTEINQCFLVKLQLDFLT